MRGDKRESYVVRPIGDQMLIVESARFFFGSSSPKGFFKKENAALTSGVHIH
jgi:hypothetical protein